MKIKDLSERQKKEIIDLEIKNIIPVLASVGINLTNQDMANEIESFKDDKVVFIEHQSSILGFVVFIFKDDFLLIKTFNIKKKNNFKIIFSLLEKITKELQKQNIQKIKSQAHLTNKRSINFHLGMGFKEIVRNNFFIEFETTRDEIIQLIEKRLQKLSNAT